MQFQSKLLYKIEHRSNMNHVNHMNVVYESLEFIALNFYQIECYLSTSSAHCAQ